MNRSYWIWGIIALVVLVGGLIWFGNTNQPAPERGIGGAPPTESPISIARPDINTVETIELTNDGFTPQSMNVKKGQKVKWVNNSDNMMWIASAPHPQHTDYPGFDQMKAVGRGESYEFTFDKTGTWRYHNHTNPNQFGMVTVEE